MENLPIFMVLVLIVKCFYAILNEICKTEKEGL